MSSPRELESKEKEKSAKCSSLFFSEAYAESDAESLKKIIEFVYNDIRHYTVASYQSKNDIPKGLKQLYEESIKTPISSDFFDNLKKIALFHSGRRSMLYLLTSFTYYDDKVEACVEFLYRIFKEAGNLSQLNASPTFKKLKAQVEEACLECGIPENECCLGAHLMSCD